MPGGMENYSIIAASQADYNAFYEQEIHYRERLSYPPCGQMCEILVSSADENAAAGWISEAGNLLNTRFHGILHLIGPSDAPVVRVKDMWRKHLYFLTDRREVFLEAIAMMQELSSEARAKKVFLSIFTQ